MQNRFPTLEVIESQLIHKEGMKMYPCLAGALTSYYVIATTEFEMLRELAQAAVDGGPDEREALEKHLQYIDAAAKFAPTVDGIAVEAKC